MSPLEPPRATHEPQRESHSPKYKRRCVCVFVCLGLWDTTEHENAFTRLLSCPLLWLLRILLRPSDNLAEQRKTQAWYGGWSEGKFTENLQKKSCTERKDTWLAYMLSVAAPRWCHRVPIDAAETQRMHYSHNRTHAITDYTTTLLALFTMHIIANKSHTCMYKQSQL